MADDGRRKHSPSTDRYRGKALEKLIEREERHHTTKEGWTCQHCGYGPNTDELSPNCQNCGRDFLGRSGTAPTKLNKEVRPGLRDDVLLDNTAFDDV